MVLVLRETAAKVAHRGGLADAGFAGDDADAGLGGEPGEDTSEALEVRVAVEEGLAGCAARERRAGHVEAFALAHATSPSSSFCSSSWSSMKLATSSRYSSVM